MKQKKSYVFVGASFRALNMYMLPMKKSYGDYCELKGLYDINPGRAQEVSSQTGIKVFEDFDVMLKETSPDVVIVATVDSTHSEYICRSLNFGCDVISEKPMTIDAESCNAVLEAEKKSGKKVTVTFNYRYLPLSTALKKLLSSGIIGDIFSVNLEWMLDRNMDVLAHGTSYFRRWNARINKSGGLLVHKSTHHFDLINWIIEQKPKTVSALGKLNIYGKTGSEKYAQNISGKNCRNCDHSKKCEFHWNIPEDEIKLYANNEKYDGYYKDGCVYAPDIDIYDTMGVSVEYDKGTVLTYSLNATCAYEGWRMSINGSKGRLEACLYDSGPESNRTSDTIRVFDLNNNLTEYHITRAAGTHGGGDEKLRKLLFEGEVSDPIYQKATSIDGAAALIIGAAANISIKEKRIVDISKLISL